jgi:hypothetical protein
MEPCSTHKKGGKNEENVKKLAEKERGLAEEERRKHLEAEVHELRAKLGLQGHA